MSGNRRVVAALVLLALASACRGGDAPEPAVAPPDATEVAAPSSSPPAQPAPPTSHDAPVSETAAAPSTPPPVGIDTAPPTPAPPASAPVSDPPQTGVPGDDGDVVCRSVGTLLVSEYLIGLVEAFGDEMAARRAEATAAPAILAAVEEVNAVLVSDGLVDDPFAARWAGLTARARTATAAGDLDGVGVAARWLELLATHDRNDPDLVLGLDPAQDAAVDAAAVAISAAHGPIATDAVYLDSVVVATPAVDAHLAQRCPEVAALTAGDAV